MPEVASLTFAALDGIAFAASRGRLADTPEYSATDLGPLIEMLQLARTGLLPPPGSAPWLRLNGSEAILRAIAGNAVRVHDALRSPMARLHVVANAVPSRPARDDATGTGRVGRAEGQE